MGVGGDIYCRVDRPLDRTSGLLYARGMKAEYIDEDFWGTVPDEVPTKRPNPLMEALGRVNWFWPTVAFVGACFLFSVPVVLLAACIGLVLFVGMYFVS